MNFLALRSFGVVAACLLFTPRVFSQPNEPPDVKRCIIPIPRTDEEAKQRFELLNERVKASAGKADVIFVGDSIPQGWEGSGKEVWAKYYAPRHAINLGIGSDHTQHVLWRLDHGNLDGLKPRVAVLLIGVNNIPDETNTPGMVLEGVTAVVQKLREKLPDTKILLFGIFPFREDFDPQRDRALQVNQALRRLDDGKWIHFLARIFHTPIGSATEWSAGL